MAMKAGVAEEMAQLVRFLPHKLEELSSIPTTHMKNPE